MKRLLCTGLLLCLFAGLLGGCKLQQDDVPVSSGAVPTINEPVQTSVSYNAETKTMTVTGSGDYQMLILPETVNTARVFEVHDDEFELSAYLPVLRELGWDLQSELVAYLERTEQSLQFLRQFLRENAGAACPKALLEKPVTIRIDRSNYGYATEGERVEIDLLESGAHRDYLYLLALTDNGAVGWEQIGYALYVTTCIDPYNEFLPNSRLTGDLPYYELCVNAGVDPSQLTLEDLRIVYDAIARIDLERDLTQWGSYFESMPVTEVTVYTREEHTPGDRELSPFMALDFLAWLDDQYGIEPVSRFCFGKQSFDEAFGTDYDSAVSAWKNWILKNYPME